MYDFKPGDKVQIDPALVNGGARSLHGVGTVTGVHQGATRITVDWGNGTVTYVPSRDLVPVADTREAAR